MFVQELKLNMEYLKRELEKLPVALPEPPKHIKETLENLLNGIDYYRRLVRTVALEQPARFLSDLTALRESLLNLSFVTAA